MTLLLRWLRQDKNGFERIYFESPYFSFMTGDQPEEFLFGTVANTQPDDSRRMAVK